MKVKLAGEIESDSIVDGEGLRTVIWFQGCSHNCLGCHNPNTHDFNKGLEFEIEDLKKSIRSLQFQQGITLSGGDPLFQIDAALELAKEAWKNNLDVWCYTGFKIEDILKMGPKYYEFLQTIDVLVDGKFELAEKSLNLRFRGSKNQRIIDVKKSLKAGKVILYKDYNN